MSLTHVIRPFALFIPNAQFLSSTNEGRLSSVKIEFQSIGTIHTPYLPALPLPHQPSPTASGEFWITLDPDLLAGLDQLSTYRYLYVLYYLDQIQDGMKLRVHPAWAPEIEVGVFASRSPNRPNPIGLSIVELKGIEGNELIISGIDVYNGTPLLDLKPYVRVLDLQPEANDGWYDALPDKDHLVAHMLGLHHEHTHHHEPTDTHEHEHMHTHEHSPHTSSKHIHKPARRIRRSTPSKDDFSATDT